MSKMVTFTPSAASARAAASPKPDAPPVTIAAMESSSFMLAPPARDARSHRSDGSPAPRVGALPLPLGLRPRPRVRFASALVQHRQNACAYLLCAALARSFR